MASRKLNEPPSVPVTGSKMKAQFIETMDCLTVTSLPEEAEWSYEIKLDGYRVEAVKASGGVNLYSRRQNVLNRQFPYIVSALEGLPDDTVLDGELVAFDEVGRSDFNALQNFRSGEARIHYYAFDVLVLKGRSLLERPLVERREMLQSIFPSHERLRLSVVDESSSPGRLLGFVQKHGLEGVGAKRTDSVYEPGQRSGLWSKHRITHGQEFVVGGYTPGSHGFDALMVGVYRGNELLFAGRVRAGFVPGSRCTLFPQLKALTRSQCPFANLPEETDGRWGQGLTAEKMEECVWLDPKIVVRLDFLEWTGGGKLRQAKFIVLREDKDPKEVVREDP